jgi:hypothetical protein
MIGHLGAGPIWACVKIDDCCDPSSTSTLAHIKSLKMSVEHAFATYNSGLLLLIVRMYNTCIAC